MTADLVEAPPEDLTADALYADDPEDTPDGDGTAEAPYGYTTDRQTGERRPKLRRGRPRLPPQADQLQGAPDIADGQDSPPPERRGRIRRRAAPPPDGDLRMPKAGVIADGVNKLYRRAGKIVRGLWDEEIGEAIIECTRPDPDDPSELTVGQAWENLARHNPRVRRVVLKAIAGGDVSDLIMAHAPIGMAVVMKPRIAARLPRLFASFVEPDEDTTPDDLTAEDVEDMTGLADSQIQRMADKVARNLSPAARAAAERAASRIANGLAPGDDPELPPELRDRLTAVRKSQPKRTSRAQRRH